MTRPTAHLCKTLERPVTTEALSLFNFADMNEDDPIIIASTENDPTDSLDFLGDIGNIEIPDVNLDFFDFDPDEVADTENRYCKPKLVPMKTDQDGAHDNPRRQEDSHPRKREPPHQRQLRAVHH